MSIDKREGIESCKHCDGTLEKYMEVGNKKYFKCKSCGHYYWEESNE
jgi:tRNA(Ile2) C34 agmatinyltransferase TiaS